MNLDSNTDHLYSPSLVTQKNTWQKMWTGYLYSADKIWIMSVGWMYCYAALDALQRILSALQDMCIANQDGCWFLFWWHTQMHWQHSNQTKRNNNIRVGNILLVVLWIQILLWRNHLVWAEEEDESGDSLQCKDRKFGSKSALEETRTRQRSSLNPLSKESLRCWGVCSVYWINDQENA